MNNFCFFDPPYILYTHSLNSLAALKVGITSQDRKPFTKTEKDILCIESNDIVQQAPFKIETLPIKSGKKLIFDEKVKIWSLDENQDTYSDLNDQNISKNLNNPVQYLQFMDLDFSVQELYEPCSGTYNS